MSIRRNRKGINISSYNMATVNMNFRADMVRIMRNEMEELGFKTKNLLDEHDLMMYYFTVNKRLVSKRPRKVHEAFYTRCSFLSRLNRSLPDLMSYKCNL